MRDRDRSCIWLVSVVEPYELPEGWKWCRLEEVCKFENGYAFKSDKFAKQGIPVVRITNLKDNEVSLEDMFDEGEVVVEEVITDDTNN